MVAQRAFTLPNTLVRFCCIGFHCFLCPILLTLKKGSSKKVKYSQRWVPTTSVPSETGKSGKRSGERAYPCTEARLKKAHPTVVYPVFNDGGPRTCQTPKHRRSPKGERNSRERKQSKRHTFANPFIKFIYNNTKRILVVCSGSEPFDATNSRGKLPFR